MTDLVILGSIALTASAILLLVAYSNLKDKVKAPLMVLFTGITYGSCVVYLVLFTIQTMREFYVDPLS